jgi:hypothetical protein
LLKNSALLPFTMKSFSKFRTFPVFNNYIYTIATT